jgi:hypothetical protein
VDLVWFAGVKHQDPAPKGETGINENCKGGVPVEFPAEGHGTSRAAEERLPFCLREGYPRPKPSQLTFESERQRFLGLKVCHVTHRVAVDFAAGFAAHLEHHRQIQLNGRVIGRIGSVLDLLKYLAPFTAWGFAVRRPIDIHRVLAKLVLIAAYEVYTVSARLDVVTVQIRSLPTSGTRRLQLPDSPSTARNSETGDTS